ncbi:MAG: NAD-dependent epimerase/dehydratase family protein, partial [Rikenellaceae bacterium]|nr:NAD-dependent epimerase/dehydratase family protein [Rikenellaceae bacterium]
MNNLTSRRIVVTGASGMVGSHIVAELLNKGYTNITVTMRNHQSQQRFQRKMGELGVDCSCVNSQDVELLNPHEVNTLLKGCDLLIHCAAQVSLGSEDGRNMIETNT